MNRSEAKLGERNPQWLGDAVGYAGIHDYVRQRYAKPELCERCQEAPPRDLANRSGRYLRDLSDWWYLCRKCHMDTDGRNDQLRESGRSRKMAIPPCKFCGKPFYRKSGQRTAVFCSRTCFFAAGGKAHNKRGGVSG